MKVSLYPGLLHHDSMNVYRLFFPRETRFFTGRRWIMIGLRTLHLLGLAGLGGGFLYHAPESDWLPYLYLTLVSGTGLMALEILANCIWLIQLRGLAVLVKLTLLGVVPTIPGLELPVMALVIGISGVVSHAPASVRYFSVFHGRRIEKF